jgi:hypothetical protein
MVPKRGYRPVLLWSAETSVETRERNARLFETLREVRQRLARMDEDKLLLCRVAPDKVDERRLFTAGFYRGPSVSKFRPNRIAGVSHRDPSNRCRGGLWRRASCAQEMIKGQPLALGFASGRKAPRGNCEVGVGLGFARAGIDLDGRGVAPRELQGDDGSGITNHRAAHQRAQAFGIGRLARLARGHISEAKFLQGFEDAGFEQRQEVVKFDQIVLHRRR